MSTVTAKTLINAQALGATDTTYYTAPAATSTIIDKLTATNTDSVSRTVTVNLVPSGQGVGTGNQITSVFAIAANTAADLTEIKNHILSTGDFISAVASSAGKIVIRASGREIV